MQKFKERYNNSNTDDDDDDNKCWRPRHFIFPLEEIWKIHWVPQNYNIALIGQSNGYFFTLHRRTLSSTGPMKTSNAVIKQIQTEVLTTVRHSVFTDLNDHFAEQDLSQEDDHGNQLVKLFSGLFLTTLLHHHGRLFTERYVKNNEASKRHTLTKNILWMGE